ncbi:hypothetical protein HWV62_13848 [Athelia sp. TMB]|nr:hypothetical protein HWV62_13848 [Athelia sp. TMB]
MKQFHDMTPQTAQEFSQWALSPEAPSICAPTDFDLNVLIQSAVAHDRTDVAADERPIDDTITFPASDAPPNPTDCAPNDTLDDAPDNEPYASSDELDDVPSNSPIDVSHRLLIAAGSCGSSRDGAAACYVRTTPTQPHPPHSIASPIPATQRRSHLAQPTH